ncbi:hypothetical protein BH20ACI2_BH20ACI2_06180 [soil metagenome]
MTKRSRPIFILILFSLAFTINYAQSSQINEIDVLVTRFEKKEHLNLLQGAMWTVTHDYADYKHMDEVLKSVFSYFEAFAKYRSGDSEPLIKLGGIVGFKDKLRIWLKDSDQAIRAFAAVLAGISGDQSLAPDVARLLVAGKPVEVEDEQMIYDRGRAAVALGMMGSTYYKSSISALLKSHNQYDRSGAISALGTFGAKEYANEIVSVMLSDDFKTDDDPSPVYFLIETGAAKDYKRQLAQAMKKGFRELPTAAMYALVSLGAKEHAGDIAQLLRTGYRREDAMKALALLGATQFSAEIARGLRDKNGLTRSAAALSLGILDAKQYAKQVATLLRDPESYVHSYAAIALLLMNARKYYPSALKEVDPKTKDYFTLDFSPIVENQTKELRERLKKSIEAHFEDNN